jgi:protein-S-isoprenylcysteine O-methyltransferase Ste14
MASQICGVAVVIVANVAFIRCGWMVVGLLKAVRNYRRASATRWGLPELLTWPEMFLLAGISTFLFVGRGVPANVTTSALVAAVSGVLLAAAALILSFWAFFSLPTMSIGHYVLGSQPVVENGPYRWIRHPVYLGVLMIWFALALAFRSLTTFLIAAVYVVPAYLFYIRSEEQMMAGAYGASYVDYCRRAGMLFPRLRRSVQAPEQSRAAAGC